MHQLLVFIEISSAMQFQKFLIPPNIFQFFYFCFIFRLPVIYISLKILPKPTTIDLYKGNHSNKDYAKPIKKDMK